MAVRGLKACLPLAAAAVLAAAGPAHGDTQLLAYFPFDGAPDEAARNLPTLVVPSGASPQAVSGKYNQAYAFDENAAVVAPLDIDFNTHRRLSFSAWVKVLPSRTESDGLIFSPGSGTTGAPKLSLVNDDVRAHGGRSKPRHNTELQTDMWTHVAATYDYDERIVRIYVDGNKESFTDLDMNPADLNAYDRNQPPLEHPLEEGDSLKRYVVIGARNFDLANGLQGVALDDMRIHSGLLTDEQVEEIRMSGVPAPLGETAPEYEPPEEADSEDEAQDAADDTPDDQEVASEDDSGGEQEAGRKLAGLRLSDEYSVSQMSGDRGEDVEIVDMVSSPITAMRTGEKSENKYMPCEIIIRSDGGHFPPHEIVHDGCARGKPVTNTFGTSPFSVRRLELSYNEDYALQDLKVCQNKRRNDRIKGLRGGAVRIDVDEDAGEFSFEHPDKRSAENANCRDWSAKAYCPGEGEVASGVRVHYNERANGTKSFTGMELLCRKVEGVYEDE